MSILIKTNQNIFIDEKLRGVTFINVHKETVLIACYLLQ